MASTNASISPHRRTWGANFRNHPNLASTTAVFKPASTGAMSGVLLMEALRDAGVPDGVCNLVMGPGETVGDELADSEAIDGSDGTTGANTVDTGTYYVSETDPGAGYSSELACVDGQGAVSVGTDGAVKANVRAQVINIEGTVEGDLMGDERTIIHQSGNVRGNLIAPRVIIEDGAKFKGNIDMDTSGENRQAAPLRAIKEEEPSAG